MLTLHLLLLLILILSVTYTTADEEEYLEPNVKRIKNVIPISICNTLIDLGEEGKSISIMCIIEMLAMISDILVLLSYYLQYFCAFISPIFECYCKLRCHISLFALLTALLVCIHICHILSWFSRPRRINRPRRTWWFIKAVYPWTDNQHIHKVMVKSKLYKRQRSIVL